MGQYYIAVILGEDGKYVRTWLQSYGYNSGSKLTEHSYINNPFVSAVEHMIGPNGMLYKSRLVWAGDYAENEEGTQKNIYTLMTDTNDTSKLSQGSAPTGVTYRFIVNHTKKLYIDKNSLKTDIHPLPLLVSEGNGRGGGDYKGVDDDICGSWARDLMSVENTEPSSDSYTEFKCNFA